MNETVPLTLDELQAMLDASPFIAWMGLRMEAANPQAQEIVVRLPFRAEFERAAGTGQWHGGVMSAFIDTVGDYALIMALRRGLPTINFRTDYLRPAMNTALIGTARVRRAGRTVGTVDIDVHDEKGALIAIGRANYATAAG